MIMEMNKESILITFKLCMIQLSTELGQLVFLDCFSNMNILFQYDFLFFNLSSGYHKVNKDHIIQKPEQSNLQHLGGVYFGW